MSRKGNSQNETNFYQLNHDRFMEWFRIQTDQVRVYLPGRMTVDKAGDICAYARKEFEKQLPDLPYIGGDQNIGTSWLLLAALWVSFYRPLTKEEFAVREIGRFMYDLFEAQLDKIPLEEHQQRGDDRFSEAFMAKLKARSEAPPLYEKDFRLTFVNGENEDFDYGLDFHSCPCADYFNEQEAGELAPFYCLIDIPAHKRMGTGLLRTQTLASGGEFCDFRFKKGRDMPQDWDSEVSKFSVE